MSLTAGFALCGSFCTIERVLAVMERMAQEGRTPCSPEKLQQAWPTWEKISDGLSESGCPGEEPLEPPRALLPAQDPKGC